MPSYFGMEHPNTDAKVERFAVCYECVYKFPGGLLSANLDNLWTFYFQSLI